jgi:hypothetical protein
MAAVDCGCAPVGTAATAAARASRTGKNCILSIDGRGISWKNQVYAIMFVAVLRIDEWSLMMITFNRPGGIYTNVTSSIFSKSYPPAWKVGSVSPESLVTGRHSFAHLWCTSFMAHIKSSG